VAALINKSIQAAILSFPHAARAERAGMKILVKTGDYIPRLGGTFITHRDFLKEKRDVTKKFIRAMVRANDYVKAHKQGTIEVIQKYFEIKDVPLAEGIYKQVATAFGPEIPHDLLMELFQSRTTRRLMAGGKPPTSSSLSPATLNVVRRRWDEGDEQESNLPPFSSKQLLR
jgi:ABC-type nitrate/sulfonate/bicarbonate transport system substrate-binding protein